MFKLAVFLALVACVFAAPKPGLLAAEPVLAAAVPAAYHTHYTAPVLKAYSAHPAPLTYAHAPVYSSYSAPLTYAHAPLYY